MCGGRSSILHYGPLMDTNYLYAPTPNGQSPSASLNKGNKPMYAGNELTAHRDITQISVTTAVYVQRRYYQRTNNLDVQSHYVSGATHIHVVKGVSCKFNVWFDPHLYHMY